MDAVLVFGRWGRGDLRVRSQDADEVTRSYEALQTADKEVTAGVSPSRSAA